MAEMLWLWLLCTAFRGLPSWLHTAGRLDNKKMMNTCVSKYDFLYFSGLLQMWILRERERVEEIMSAYGELTGDHPTLTACWYSLSHLNVGAFINISTWGWQLSSRQVTKVFSFQLVTLLLYTSRLLSGYFRCLISRSSYFSFQCVRTTWLVNLSTCHSFPISATLCHLYPLSF